LAEVMQRRHVDLVDVGAFLAVHFDVDEEIVHHLRGCRVLEALVRHDVTPMAGGVTDREPDRPVGGTCPGDGPVCPLATIAGGWVCAAADRGWSRGRGGFRGR